MGGGGGGEGDIKIADLLPLKMYLFILNVGCKFWQINEDRFRC